MSKNSVLVVSGRMMIFRTISVFVLCSAVLSEVTAQEEKIERERGSRFIVEVGDEVPHFSYTTTEGDVVDSDFLRGQVVLIHFAASWCPISTLQRADTQKRLLKRYGDKDFSAVCVTIDEAKDTTLFKEMIRAEGIEYPVVLDTEERVYRQFVTPKGSVTRSVVIGRDGRISYLCDEYNRKKAKEINKAIFRGLKKR